jgi:hypothetical protein
MPLATDVFVALMAGLLVLVVIKLLPKRGSGPVATPLSVALSCSELMTVPQKHLPEGRVVEVETLWEGGAYGRVYGEMYLNGTPHIFLVDTGYGGPPVLNTWHFRRQQRATPAATMSQRLEQVLAVRLSPLADSGGASAPEQLGCTPVPVQCPVRLAGISSVEVNHLNLSQCPLSPSPGNKMATLETPRMVVMHIPRVPHILTLDYMLSFGGMVLRPGVPLRLGPVGDLKGWRRLRTRATHGVYTVRIRVGGADGWFTLDTGSSFSVVAGHTFASQGGVKLSGPPDGHVGQRGMNGERTCGDIYKSQPIQLLCEPPHRDIEVRTPVVVNSTDTYGVDGYVGLELVRALGGVAMSPLDSRTPGVFILDSVASSSSVAVSDNSLSGLSRGGQCRRER